MDLSGNMSEWALDGWGGPTIGECNDCARYGTSSIGQLEGLGVIRGGSWHYWNLTAAYRSIDVRNNRFADVGFRCMRNQ